MIKRFLLYFGVVVLFVSSVLVATGIYTSNHLQESIATPKLLYIPKGSLKNTVIYLKNEGIDLHWLDYYLIRIYGLPQAGWISLDRTSLTREAFFEKITHAKAAAQAITLIPGETNVIFIEILAKELDLNITKLEKSYSMYAPYHDGVIFADTYQIPIGIDEDALMKHLIDKSLHKHKKLAKRLLRKYVEKEWFEDVVIKASIIQKEAANEYEMPLVSAVIANRLKKNMKLQMDGTLNYGLFSHIAVTAKKIRLDSSKFNTYKHAGLPPYPICSVSEKAIEAAINPAKVDYLYFVKIAKGKHIFTKTYKEHLKHIK